MNKECQKINIKISKQNDTSLGTFRATRKYDEFNLLYNVTTRENKNLTIIQFNK